MLIESSHTITLDWVKTLLYGNHVVVITPRTAPPWCCATSDTRNHNLNRCVNFWMIILHRTLMHLDKLSKSNMNKWTWFVRSVSWIHCAQTIIPSKCLYSYFLVLVLRRAKTADVLRVSSGDSLKQDTRGIKGKRNGVIISWVCCSLYFLN